MAKLLRLRRGTTTDHSTFTGAEGEVTVDITKDTAVVHDGATAGGRPLLREDLNNLAAGAIGTASIADDAVTAAKLADTAVTPGSYGSATAIPAITVDAQGRITAATTNTVNTTTDLTTTTAASSVTVNSSTGTDATISAATTSVAGVMSSTDKSKLDGIESGATADQTASEILSLLTTVDGAGSGLDADLLDGQSGAFYSNYNNLSNLPTIGNGTIQINQGGSSKGSFTLNQTGNTTFNLDGGSTNPLNAVQFVGFRDPWTGSDGAYVTGLQLSVTPYTSGERHLITVVLSGTGASDGMGAVIRVNGNPIAVCNDGASSRNMTMGGTPAWNNPHGVGTVSWTWLYHPNTTSTQTYTVQMQNNYNNTMRINHNPGVSDPNQPGGTSSLTVVRFA